MYSREWMAKMRRREARKKKQLEAASNGRTTIPNGAIVAGRGKPTTSELERARL
jgi:hypothetical protein